MIIDDLGNPDNPLSFITIDYTVLLLKYENDGYNVDSIICYRHISEANYHTHNLNRKKTCIDCGARLGIFDQDKYYGCDLGNFSCSEILIKNIIE